MGTRNLTCVVIDGEYKVAQYGQWDGYPSGQGLAAMEFLSQPEAQNRLKQAAKRCRFLDQENNEADRAFVEKHNELAPKFMGEEDRRPPEMIEWFNKYISRDLGAEILANVADATQDEILLNCALNFAGDSLMCEWGYVIDFDNGTFEVFDGFNKKPLAEGERFYGFEQDSPRYFPIKHVHTFQLDALPTREEFLSILEPKGE